MKAWLFQDNRQKQKLGDKCPWSVGWFDPDGKKKSKSIGCQSLAAKFARKIEGQLASGTYQGESRKQWKQFQDEYDGDLAARVDPETRRVAVDSLKRFAKVIKPGRVDRIRTKTIDQFVALRRADRGRVPGSKISVATINKELRHLKASLRKAHEWGYLPVVPNFHMVKEPKKLLLYVTPEHFAAIYQACDVATGPAGSNYLAADWWRTLLMFDYMTGWRIGEILALSWDDVSLDQGYAITRHDDNKGGRDEQVPLHKTVIEHLRKIVDFGHLVFPWPKDKRSLYEEFARIQTAAAIDLPCHERHEHTDACHRYGFHDLRRAFATMNADRLTGDALQALMRHKSYSTTQRYINIARQLDQSAADLYVPNVERKTAAV
jgi:integrase